MHRLSLLDELLDWPMTTAGARLLRGEARSAAAERIRALAGEGRTDPQIGRELRISPTIVQQIRAEKGIEAGSKRAGRLRAATCPVCGVPELEMTEGVLAPHKRLGRSQGLVAPAVPCPGTGLAPETQGDAK